MSFKSTQTRIEFRPDGCQYRTVIQETCNVDRKTRETKCEKAKKVFRKCPNDRAEVEIQSEGDMEVKLRNPYAGVATDV